MLCQNAKEVPNGGALKVRNMFLKTFCGSFLYLQQLAQIKVLISVFKVPISVSLVPFFVSIDTILVSVNTIFDGDPREVTGRSGITDR
jgi:hypothetical protein